MSIFRQCLSFNYDPLDLGSRRGNIPATLCGKQGASMSFDPVKHVKYSLALSLDVGSARETTLASYEVWAHSNEAAIEQAKSWAKNKLVSCGIETATLLVNRGGYGVASIVVFAEA